MVRTRRISTPTPILAVLSQIMLESVQKLVGQQQVIQKCISSENQKTWENTLIEFWTSSFPFRWQRSWNSSLSMHPSSYFIIYTYPRWSSTSWSNTHRQVSGNPGSPEKKTALPTARDQELGNEPENWFPARARKTKSSKLEMQSSVLNASVLGFFSQPPMAQKNPLEAAFRVNYMPYQ